jgi:hypothetical protein
MWIGNLFASHIMNLYYFYYSIFIEILVPDMYNVLNNVSVTDSLDIGDYIF